MVTDTPQKTLPPYISFSTLTTLLDWVREMPVTPSQIDRSLLEPKFAGSVGGQLMGGLRFLLLLDGNNPTQRLGELARADNQGRKQLLAQRLLDSYGDELIKGLRTDTPKMFDDKLRALGTTDATHRKAASFLINAAKYAELEIQPSVSRRARNKPSGTKRRRGKSGDGEGEGENGEAKVLAQAKDCELDTPKMFDDKLRALGTQGCEFRSMPQNTPNLRYGENGEAKVKPEVRVDHTGNYGERSIDSVNLPSGATVTLAVDMNPLKVTKHEREWLFDLIDTFHQFKPPQVTDQEQGGTE